MITLDDFNLLMPEPKGIRSRMTKHANVKETMIYIKSIIALESYQVAQLAPKLQAATTLLTCANVWEFCRAFKRKESADPGVQYLRTPSRTWADRAEGVGFADVFIFAACLLSELKIPYTIYLCKIGHDTFTHTIMRVPDLNGEILVDVGHSIFNEKHEAITEEKKIY